MEVFRLQISRRGCRSSDRRLGTCDQASLVWESGRAESSRGSASCPNCGEENIKADESGNRGFSTSTHVVLSCKTPACTFVERKVERSILGTARANIRAALLLSVVLGGAILLAWVTGVFGKIHGETEPPHPTATAIAALTAPDANTPVDSGPREQLSYEMGTERASAQEYDEYII
jgi:hypothetical protein